MSSEPEPTLNNPNEHPEDRNIHQARLHIRAEVPPGVTLRITVEQLGTDGKPNPEPLILGATGQEESTAEVQLEPVVSATKKAAPSFWLISNRISSAWGRMNLSLAGVLLGAALLIYLVTRLIGLAQFPIYFFTDEAVQTLLASDFLRDGLKGYDGQFLPTYFLNVYQYNLGVSVYLQIIPFLLFGKAIWVTRGICVLMTLMAAAGVAFTLKEITKTSFAWVAVLLLSITPAWFLHSRTAFETSLAVSFYAGFVACYLRYRSGDVRFLYYAVILGALAFYSYSPAQMVVGLTGLLLLFSDARYHWQQRRFLVNIILLLVVLALPYVRFQVTHQGESLHHLSVLNSYWIQPIPFQQKLLRFGQEILHGFDPFYWYLPNNRDLARHLMYGYGHLLLWTLPLAALGLVKVVRNLNQPGYRLLLIIALAAPTGAALVAIGITRALFVVLPAALLSALGLSMLMEWVLKRIKIPRSALAVAVFVLLAGFNVYMMRDALVNGPLWFSDYGLGGMQYGGSQIFGEVNRYLEKSPDTRIVVSSAWANGADVLGRFFSPEPLKYELGSIEGYYYEHKPLDKSMVFVVIPEEYGRLLQSNKFTDIEIEKMIAYPDGRAGFYFMRLRYVDNIDQILAVERASRQVLQQANVTVSGHPARVEYSYLDMGSIENIFDGNLETMARTMENNPMKINLQFSQPEEVKGLGVKIGGTATRVTVDLELADETRTLNFSQEVTNTPNPRTLDLDFGGSWKVSQIRVQVKSVNDKEPAHVHLWEVFLK